jgi:hypothetical protein
MNMGDLDLTKMTLKQKIDDVFEMAKVIEKVTDSEEGKLLIKGFIKRIVDIVSELFKQSLPALVESGKNAVKLIPFVGDILALADLLDDLGKVIIKVSKTAFNSALITLETVEEMVSLSKSIQAINKTIKSTDKMVTDSIVNGFNKNIDEKAASTLSVFGVQDTSANPIKIGGNSKKTIKSLLKQQKGGLKRIQRSINDFLSSGITSKQVLHSKNRKTKRKYNKHK